MIGPPGAGKTMLARRLPALLPPLSTDEALEVTAIHSVAGLLSTTRGLSRARPFRAPHHTVSEVGLVGGGEGPRPGEVSLAHHGVLFLDELAEFRRAALEALRQPLEDGVVTISRANAKATFPARLLLVCAMNPCACGWLGDGSGRCGCSVERVRAVPREDERAAARSDRRARRPASGGGGGPSVTGERREERGGSSAGRAGASDSA